jgi:hypothetical protein
VTRSINANAGYIYKTYRLFYYPRGTAVPVTMVV